MLNILSEAEWSKDETYVLPAILPDGPDAAPGRAPEHAGSCRSCGVYSPSPQLSGNLQVDPETHLPGPFPLDISWFYNGSSTQTGPFGYGRTMSTYLTAQASGTNPLVTLTRGNGALVSYLYNGTSYVPQTPGCLNALTQDSVNGYWKETTLDGQVTAYPLDTTGHITSVAYIQDSVGNIHSHTYSSGLLSSIEDGPGRLCSFAWSGSQLTSFTDWAGRMTQFQYDTVTASPLDLLTTVIGPTLCNTAYKYATFTQYSGGSYSSKWLLSGIVSPNGYGTSYLYDMQSRVTGRIIQGVGQSTYLYQPGYMTTIDPLGSLLTQALGTDFSLSGAQNQLGYITSYTRNANLQETGRQMPLGGVWTRNYTTAGLVSSEETPLGAITTYGHDSYNNVQTKQTPDGAIWTTLWGYAGSSFDTTGAKGRPQVTIDPLGNAVTTTYQGQGLPASVQDMLGYITTFGYNSYGDRVTRQDSLGHTWSTTRDAAGNATAEINPLGAIWSQTFDEMARPLVSTDPLNLATTVGYDSEGNQTILIKPLGYITSWSYNAFNLQTQQIDALGNYSTTLFDALGREVGSIDSLGNISSQIWNVASQLVATQNPLGARWSQSFDANNRQISSTNPLAFVNSVVWDSADRMLATVDPLGNRTSGIFDVNSRQIASQNPLGFLGSTVFDLASRPIASVDSLGNRSTTTWDARDLPVAQTDPLGRSTSTAFNGNRDLVATMDPGGFIFTAILDTAQRQVASLDANGNLSSTVFDIADRPIARVNALNYRFSTSYDADSNPIQTTDPLNRISTNVMDALDRVQATISPVGYITTTNRDADGRVVSRQNALGYYNSTIFDKASRPVASVSPLGYYATKLWDIADRDIGSQNPLGFIYTNVLDAVGRTIAVINPLAYRSSTVFDAASQRLATIDASGNRASQVWAANGRLIAEQNQLGFLTSFVLDAASQRVCVVDANSGRSTTVWDVRGLESARQDQLGRLTSFSHDPNRNTTMRVDGRSWPTSYTVDALNRTAQTLYVDSTRVTNTWDGAGQRTGSQDVTGAYGYVFDLDGRKTATQNPTGIKLTNTLDALGTRLVLQDSYGVTTYTNDIQSRLLTIWNPVNERTTITWDALDREQHRVLANGGAISHTWDANGRETLIQNLNASGAGLAIFTNTYSPTDNRLTVLELDGTRATFSYDASSQIVSEARGGTMAYARSYVWDGLGNRLQQYDSGVLTSGTFNAANQQLLISPAGGAPTTQSFDAVGNLTLINKGGALTTQTWTPENRLASLINSTGTSEQYLCSDDGLRRSETKQGVVTLFTYDEMLVLLETTAAGVLNARNTDYPGKLGGLASQNRGGVSSFYGYDSNWNVRILVSVAGMVTDSYSYKAFGDPVQTGSGTVNPHTYVGLERYRLQTIGNYLLSVRILDPFTGRFTTVDTIWFDVGESNPYGYSNNSPARYTDPSGMEPQFGPGYSWPGEQLKKCRQGSTSPGVCFNCAYSYIRESFGTGNQSDYFICVRTNAYCHSHLNCENGYRRNSFPPGSPPPVLPPVPPKPGRRLFPGPPNTRPTPIGNPGPIDWIPLPNTLVLPAPIPGGWIQVRSGDFRTGLQEVCSEDPGNSLAGLASPGAAGGLTCTKINTMITDLLIKCQWDVDRAYCEDLEKNRWRGLHGARAYYKNKPATLYGLTWRVAGAVAFRGKLARSRWLLA